MAFIELHLFSDILGMNMEVDVILPQQKQACTEKDKFKVLWLLHGGSGDNTSWSRMTCIERYAVEYGITVVCPNVMHSCYTNMVHGGRFLTYVTDELPGILQHMFPQLSSRRADNYISGASNGGYGCLRVGLARPDLYSAIGAFGAGDKSDVHFGPERMKEKQIIFGEGDIKDTGNDLKYLGREALKKETLLPHIYHACGSVDPWVDLNHLMRDFFSGLPGNPYAYQYHEVEGYGHSWDLFALEIPCFLNYLGLNKCTGRYTGA